MRLSPLAKAEYQTVTRIGGTTADDASRRVPGWLKFGQTHVKSPFHAVTAALRAINLYCDLVAGAVFSGLQSEVTASGGDLGETFEVPVEDLPPKPEVTSEAAKLESEAAPAEEIRITEEAMAADAEVENK